MICNIPNIIDLNSYNGDYSLYEDAVYAAFVKCVKSMDERTLLFRGMMVAHKRHPEYDGKSATFWHIISQGENESARIPDLRRYERIAWPFYILESCADHCDNLLIWENARKGNTRVLLFCTDLDYLVVLAKRNGYLVFWTAYPVNQSHQRNKLIKEYHDYMARTAQS